MLEYLDEIEYKFENNLGCLSGAQMGLNHEKRGRNSRDTLPLRCKYLREVEVIIENPLAFQSEAQIG